MDRTNYYETLPATGDNLEFAIQLEADRLVNSKILGEDLASEMTVVRNEFESGENSPFRVLMQRVQAAAYEWHNYGQTTIGNRSDIERVPVVKLRQFYRKFYRPDNVMVIVAGKFKDKEALSYLNKYFGVSFKSKDSTRWDLYHRARSGRRTYRRGPACGGNPTRRQCLSHPIGQPPRLCSSQSTRLHPQ